MPTIVATTGIWADVVSNVACEGIADVEAVIPDGADPHSFEPSLADRGRLESAALIVANGLGLEESLEGTIDAVEETGRPVFHVGEHVEVLTANGAGHVDEGHDEESGHGDDADHEEDADHDKDAGHEAGEGHDEDAAHDEDAGHNKNAGDEAEHSHEGGGDPHIWLDPTRIASALPELGDALVEQAGLNRADVDACAGEYAERLANVDAEIREMLEPISADRRRLVTNHDALGYFADRYEFSALGTVIPAPTTLAATNPAQLEELATTIEEAGVAAIFAEDQHSDTDARALADRVGDVDVVTLFTGSLGPEGSGAETYTGLLLTNTGLIAQALG